MTVNGAFVDVRDIVGASTRPSLLGRAIYDIGNERWSDAVRSLEAARALQGAVRDKFRAWDARADLIERISVAQGVFRLTDRDRISKILGLQSPARAVPIIRRATDFDTQASDPHAEALLDILRLHQDKLATYTRALLLTARLAQRSEGPDTLFTAAGDEFDAFTEADGRSADRLRVQLAGEPWRANVADDGTLRLTMTGPDPINLARYSDCARLALALSHETELLLNDVRSDLQREFLPNTAAAPMPTPFVLDLRAPSTDNRTDLVRIPVDLGHSGVDNVVRVAALQCGVPDDWFVEDESSYSFDTSRVELLTEVVRASIRDAASSGAAAVVFPEIFIPARAVEEVRRLSEETGILVIGGVEMHRSPFGVVNRVLVIAPSGKSYEQRKQRPSVYEVRRNDFASDGQVRVVRASPIGTFAVSICSDYLEHDYLNVLQEGPHVPLLVVCSRNHHPDIYRFMAASDAYRQYAFVLVCNGFPDTEQSGASGRGTLVAGPIRDSPFVEPTEVRSVGTLPWPSPHDAPSLAVFDLNLAAIASRNLERQAHGFMRPPNFTRRR
ncbi:MAG: hypothetical protein JWM34_3633 [Ilumatobacteraceae bacterium]|nr:hypothetical protein [Ilumatobacteraceae bacterium]